MNKKKRNFKKNSLKKLIKIYKTRQLFKKVSVLENPSKKGQKFEITKFSHKTHTL